MTDWSAVAFAYEVLASCANWRGFPRPHAAAEGPDLDLDVRELELAAGRVLREQLGANYAL